jgi:hypothetical protein
MFNTFPPRPPAPNFPWLRAVLAGGARPHRQQLPYHVQHQPRPHLQQQQQVVHFSRRAHGPIWTNGIRTPSARNPSPYHRHPTHFTPAPVMPHYVPPAFRQEYWTNGMRTPSARTPSTYHHHPNHFTPAPVMPHYVPPAFRQEYWTNGIRTPSARTPSTYHHHPNHFTPAPVMPHYVPPAFRQDRHHGQQPLHQPEQHHVRIRDIPNQMNSNPNHMRAADLAPADQYPHPHELASTSQQLKRSYFDSHYPPYQAPGSKSWQKRKGTHMHILAAIASNT